MPRLHSVMFALAGENPFCLFVSFYRETEALCHEAYFGQWYYLPSEVNCYNKIQQESVQLIVSAKHGCGHGLGSGVGSKEHVSSHHKGEERNKSN